MLRVMVLSCVLVAFARTASAEVLVVDGSNGPGTDFSNLMQAVDAAADGDVLLVRPGQYFVWNEIVGKSLTIAGDASQAQVSGQLTVRDLAADQSVTLRFLRLRYPGGLDVLDCAGPVIVEDCQILADHGGGTGQYGAVRVRASRLALRDTRLEGSWYYWAGDAQPTPALFVEDGEVVVHDGFLAGGGGLDTYGDDQPGAPGIVAHDSQIELLGVVVVGGTGDSQAGGAGVVVTGASALVLRDTSPSGGSGAPVGPSLIVEPSVAQQTVSDPAVDLTLTSPVREGQQLGVQAVGAEGDTLWLALALDVAWLPLAAGRGVFSVSEPFAFVPLGTLGPDGETGFDLTVPELGVDGAPLHAQLLVQPAGGGAWWAADGSTALLLDGAL